MAQVNIYEAKTHLSALVERALAGEDIVIARAGLPRVRLVPIDGPAVERRPGRGRGKIEIAADFDGPMTAEFEAAFGMDSD